MKRLAAALAALALLLSLAGCGRDGAERSPAPAPTPSAAPSPTPGAAPGTMEFVLPYYGDGGFHPITGTNRTNLTLAPLLYEGLYELDGAFEPQPLLCEAAFVSGDGLTWSFTLRQGAAFSDGSPLTAADAAYSLQLAMGEGAPYATRLKNIRAVRAEADGTLTVALNAPNGNLPALLDVPVVKETEAGPLGTGPYVLRAEGDELSLEARTDWWRNEPLPFDHIRLYAVQGADGLIHAFDTREISLVAADITGSNALGYSGSYEAWDYPTSVMLFMGYNAERGPCREAAVRRALSYGYERGAVAKSLFAQHAQAAALPVSPASGLYDEKLSDSLGYAPQTMEALLDEAGWTLSDGARVKGKETLSLTLLVNSENSYKSAAADYLASGLTRAGAAVTVRKLPWDDYAAALAAGDFDLYLGEVRLTADFDLSDLLTPGGALNYGGYRDEAVQGLLAAFRSAGGEARKTAASALYRGVAESAPFTPICFKNWSVLTHWGRLTGLSPTQQNVFYGFPGWKTGK